VLHFFKTVRHDLCRCGIFSDIVGWEGLSEVARWLGHVHERYSNCGSSTVHDIPLDSCLDERRKYKAGMLSNYALAILITASCYKLRLLRFETWKWQKIISLDQITFLLSLRLSAKLRFSSPWYLPRWPTCFNFLENIFVIFQKARQKYRKQFSRRTSIAFVDVDWFMVEMYGCYSQWFSFFWKQNLMYRFYQVSYLLSNQLVSY